MSAFLFEAYMAYKHSLMHFEHCYLVYINTELFLQLLKMLISSYEFWHYPFQSTTSKQKQDLSIIQHWIRFI